MAVEAGAWMCSRCPREPVDCAKSGAVPGSGTEASGRGAGHFRGGCTGDGPRGVQIFRASSGHDLPSDEKPRAATRYARLALGWVVSPRWGEETAAFAPYGNVLRHALTGWACWAPVAAKRSLTPGYRGFGMTDLGRASEAGGHAVGECREPLAEARSHFRLKAVLGRSFKLRRAHLAWKLVSRFLK